jgi:hypothetical protein
MNPSMPNPAPKRRRGRPPKALSETSEETAARLQRNRENKLASQRRTNRENKERANARRTSSAGGASAIESATIAAPSGINSVASEPLGETDSDDDVEAQSSSSQLLVSRRMNQLLVSGRVNSWLSSVSGGMDGVAHALNRSHSD